MTKRIIALPCLLVLLAGCGRIQEVASSYLGAAGPAVPEDPMKALHAADDLLDASVKPYAVPDEDGGFARHERSTAPDPWGSNLRVDYEQVWDMEVVTIRSAGPDRTFYNFDDMLRTREAPNMPGLLRGIPTSLWVAAGWLACAVGAFLSYRWLEARRVASGRRLPRTLPSDSGPLRAALLVLLAPFLLVAYAFVALLIAVAALFGHDTESIDFNVFDFD